MATALADGTSSEEVAREGGRRSRLWWPAVALPAALAVAYTVATRRLTGDLHHVLAALRTGGEAGYSPSEVFTHRPYFYRWFVAGLDTLTFGSGGTAVRETVMEAAGVLLAAAAALALYTALRRRVSGREAAFTAGATGLALALAPRNDFLQPEWAAVVLTVVAVAAALGPARPWRGALYAALPLGLAVMMKYSTAATAAIGVLLVYTVDRGRAVRAALAAVPGAVALFGLSLLGGTHEWQWTGDMPRINQSALGRTGVHPGHVLGRTVDFLADRAVESPVLLLLPGALLLLLARVRGRGRRTELALVAVAAGLGAQAVVVVQGNWFLYHGAQMPVLAAALWGLAVGGARRSPPWCFAAVTLLYGALPVLYARAPEGAQRPYVVWAAGLLALLAVGADGLVEARGRTAAKSAADRPGRPRTGPAVLVALAGVVCAAASDWPGSPHLVLHGKVTMTNAGYLDGMRRTERDADRLRDRIPAGAPVLYLAFGDTTYYVGRPARCRYPVATFLQRTRYLADVTGLDSYKENADCVDHAPAPYAVLDRAWFRPGNVDPVLWRRVTAVYDCPPASAGTKTVLCVRGSGTP
ncbi:hypothetical protein ACFY93_01360 [Streptomyces sp. NPDC008313]|uniref:hypothetical protein n=1 Tax=Streptomyces sp. NPDC008313 TaxID=3364826 RepID=UPI0036EE3884